jgi:hypothetical protein
MERRMIVAGIWVLALAFGILGFQVLTYHFYDYWQPVTVEFVWGKLFAPWPVYAKGALNTAIAWFGRLPLLAVGIALGYLCFLVADSVRQQDTILQRQPLSE